MTLTDLADNATRTVLENLWQGAPAQRVDSPPGAGKTGLVERVAAMMLGVLRARRVIDLPAWRYGGIGATFTMPTCPSSVQRNHSRSAQVVWLSATGPGMITRSRPVRRS